MFKHKSGKIVCCKNGFLFVCFILLKDSVRLVIFEQHNSCPCVMVCMSGAHMVCWRKTKHSIGLDISVQSGRFVCASACTSTQKTIKSHRQPADGGQPLWRSHHDRLVICVRCVLCMCSSAPSLKQKKKKQQQTKVKMKKKMFVRFLAHRCRSYCFYLIRPICTSKHRNLLP